MYFDEIERLCRGMIYLINQQLSKLDKIFQIILMNNFAMSSQDAYKLSQEYLSHQAYLIIQNDKEAYENNVKYLDTTFGSDIRTLYELAHAFHKQSHHVTTIYNTALDTFAIYGDYALFPSYSFRELEGDTPELTQKLEAFCTNNSLQAIHSQESIKQSFSGTPLHFSNLEVKHINNRHNNKTFISLKEYTNFFHETKYLHGQAFQRLDRVIQAYLAQHSNLTATQIEQMYVDYFSFETIIQNLNESTFKTTLKTLNETYGIKVGELYQLAYWLTISYCQLHNNFDKAQTLDNLCTIPPYNEYDINKGYNLINERTNKFCDENNISLADNTQPRFKSLFHADIHHYYELKFRYESFLNRMTSQPGHFMTFETFEKLFITARNDIIKQLHMLNQAFQIVLVYQYEIDEKPYLMNKSLLSLPKHRRVSFSYERFSKATTMSQLYISYEAYLEISQKQETYNNDLNHLKETFGEDICTLYKWAYSLNKQLHDITTTYNHYLNLHIIHGEYTSVPSYASQDLQGKIPEITQELESWCENYPLEQIESYDSLGLYFEGNLESFEGFKPNHINNRENETKYFSFNDYKTFFQHANEHHENTFRHLDYIIHTYLSKNNNLTPQEIEQIYSEYFSFEAMIQNLDASKFEKNLKTLSGKFGNQVGELYQLTCWLTISYCRIHNNFNEAQAHNNLGKDISPFNEHHFNQTADVVAKKIKEFCTENNMPKDYAKQGDYGRVYFKPYVYSGVNHYDNNKEYYLSFIGETPFEEVIQLNKTAKTIYPFTSFDKFENSCIKAQTYIITHLRRVEKIFQIILMKEFNINEWHAYQFSNQYISYQSFLRHATGTTHYKNTLAYLKETYGADIATLYEYAYALNLQLCRIKTLYNKSYNMFSIYGDHAVIPNYTLIDLKGTAPKTAKALKTFYTNHKIREINTIDLINQSWDGYHTPCITLETQHATHDTQNKNLITFDDCEYYFTEAEILHNKVFQRLDLSIKIYLATTFGLSSTEIDNIFAQYFSFTTIIRNLDETTFKKNTEELSQKFDKNTAKLYQLAYWLSISYCSINYNYQKSLQAQKTSQKLPPLTTTDFINGAVFITGEINRFCDESKLPKDTHELHAISTSDFQLEHDFQTTYKQEKKYFNAFVKQLEKKKKSKTNNNPSDEQAQQTIASDSPQNASETIITDNASETINHIDLTPTPQRLQDFMEGKIASPFTKEQVDQFFKLYYTLKQKYKTTPEAIGVGTQSITSKEDGLFVPFVPEQPLYTTTPATYTPYVTPQLAPQPRQQLVSLNSFRAQQPLLKIGGGGGNNPFFASRSLCLEFHVVGKTPTYTSANNTSSWQVLEGGKHNIPTFSEDIAAIQERYSLRNKLSPAANNAILKGATAYAVTMYVFDIANVASQCQQGYISGDKGYKYFYSRTGGMIVGSIIFTAFVYAAGTSIAAPVAVFLVAYDIYQRTKDYYEYKQENLDALNRQLVRDISQKLTQKELKQRLQFEKQVTTALKRAQGYQTMLEAISPFAKKLHTTLETTYKTKDLMILQNSTIKK